MKILKCSLGSCKMNQLLLVCYVTRYKHDHVYYSNPILALKVILEISTNLSVRSVWLFSIHVRHISTSNLGGFTPDELSVVASDSLGTVLIKAGQVGSWPAYNLQARPVSLTLDTGIIF